MTSRPLSWPLGVVVFCVWQTYGQIGVWRDDVTLWGHAATIAPFKPRVALNYGTALLETGQTREAIAQWRRASQLTRAPHVSVADAEVTRRTVAANIQALREASR